MMLYSASAQTQLPLNMTLPVAYAGNRVWYFGEQQEHQFAAGAVPSVAHTASYTAQQANVTALQTAVPNPMAGLIPTDSTINGKTIQQQYLDLPFPEFGTLTELEHPQRRIFVQRASGHR